MASNALDGGMLVPEPAMVQMFPSGTYVDLLDPKADTILPEDIAHHTGMTVRYGGGVRRFYSVAEHASLVADLVTYMGHSRDMIAAALLHDAAEAYVGDVVSPLKYALRLREAMARGEAHRIEGDNGQWFEKPPHDLRGIYSELADGVDRAIAERFGLEPEMFEHPDVKLADMWALRIEAAELTYGRGNGWRWPGTLPNGGKLPEDVRWLGGLNAEAAGALWLDRMERLGYMVRTGHAFRERLACVLEEDVEVLDRLERGEWAPEDDDAVQRAFDGGYA